MSDEIVKNGTSDITITSEADLLELAQRVLINDEKMPSNITFDGWPKAQIVVNGGRYESSLPTSLMNGLIEYQSAINRSYCLMRYNSTNLTKLSPDEKKRLELVFHIEKGSTRATHDATSQLGEIFNDFTQAVGNMDSTHQMAVWIVFILVVGGSFSYSAYNSRKKKEAEAEAEVKKLDAAAEAGAKTLEAARALVYPVLNEKSKEEGQQIAGLYEDAKTKVVKSAHDATSISIGEQRYSRQDIREISKRDWIAREKEEVSGNYMLTGMRHSSEDGRAFFSVIDAKDDSSFSVTVDLSFQGEHYERLIELLKTKSTVSLSLELALKSGQITDARLINILDDE